MDYGPIIGSGAEKLAESAVAPLVAVAHGFQSLTSGDVKGMVEELGVATNSTAAKQVKAAVGNRDAMVMRWFSPMDVIEQAKATDYLVRASSFQVRPHPANVKTEVNGKKRKYENIAGQALVFGIHPATPASWLLEPIEHLLLAEGAMKADSAMTAYLRHHGATDDDLSVTEDMTPWDAIAKMRPMLEAIDKSERVVIMSIVGVGTWHKNSEWNTLKLDGAEVWVSFDGDVGQNPAVWTQANDMFRFLRNNKKATPMLLDLSDLRAEGDNKMGVDDYLATGKEWDDLMARIVTELPKQPEGVGGGRYRMNPKTCQMEERVTSKDADGNEHEEWHPKTDLIARVKRIDERREVTPDEEESGLYSTTVSAKDVESDAIIEVEWLQGTDRYTSDIEGPATLLASRPERWTDPRMNAYISADVLNLPTWPPTANGFLEAMKSHRRDDMDRNAAWTHMGWVPRKEGTTPSFIVGQSVITPDGMDEEAKSICGVTEADLAGVTNFGVALPEDDEQARQDIRDMMRLYSACWSDKRNLAVVIAAALRPTVPLPCNVPLYFSGASGVGKTWTAAALMAFWQAHPGAWTDKRLPGSANDTQAATEIALSKTPIWVSDDHAPSSANPRAQAERTEAINQTIRNVHNGAAKRRATQTMGSQKTHTPRALYVVSAESAPLDDQSIMNRMVHIEVAPGFLVPSREPTDAVEKWNRDDNACARITGRALLMLARRIKAKSWRKVVAEWNERLEDMSADIGRIIKSRTGDETSSKRQSETVGSMMLGIEVFSDLCDELGLAEEFTVELQDMYMGLQTLAIEGFSENKRLDLGNRFFGDIKMLLHSQQAHIAALGVPGAPCVVGSGGVENAAQADAYNQALGWELTGDVDRPTRAKGETIGWLINTKDDEPVVLLTDAAFQQTQRKAQNRGGLNAKSAFDAMWKSGIPVPEDEGWRRKARSGNKLDYRVRVMTNGVSAEGVPVYLRDIVN